MTDLSFQARHQVSLTVAAMGGGHDPLKALGALTQLRAAVTRAERDAARRAREDGRTWHDIGEALGFKGLSGFPWTSVAERAFLATASDLGSGPVVAWECPVCGGMVTDRGPETGHPADAEEGHRGSCARLTATVKAWNAQWEGSE